VGVDGGEDSPGRGDESSGEAPPPAPGDSAPPFLGPRRRIALGAFFAVLYAASFIARGEVAAGIVGAVLGGALVYLILKEADERRRRRWRANRPGPRP
jgi:hypothetical protein